MSTQRICHVLAATFAFFLGMHSAFAGLEEQELPLEPLDGHTCASIGESFNLIYRGGFYSADLARYIHVAPEQLLTYHPHYATGTAAGEMWLSIDVTSYREGATVDLYVADRPGDDWSFERSIPVEDHFAELKVPLVAVSYMLEFENGEGALHTLDNPLVVDPASLPPIDHKAVLKPVPDCAD